MSNDSDNSTSDTIRPALGSKTPASASSGNPDEVRADHPVRTRFAPSPTGHLHVGVCRTAIFAWALARHSGGQFLLRIEDTDREREVEGARESIRADLRWLGLDWDEGPDIGGPVGPYVQSERLALYRDYAERLVLDGKAYRCFCTRERLEAMRQEQIANKQPPGYDRRCRDLPGAQRALLEAGYSPGVIRIRMPLEGETAFHDAIRGEVRIDNTMLDDFVAIKSDGFPTYNFANVIDDHLMGITHIIRGEEFISSTPRFIVLYDHLGWKPPVMAHVPLVLGPNRAKLSKRHGDTTLAEYRERGFLPEALVNFLVLLGWSPGHDIERMSREEIVSRFTIDRFQKHAAVFDLTKLEWMNGEYIRSLPEEELARRLEPFLADAGLYPVPPGESDRAYLLSLMPLVRDRIRRLDEAAGILDIYLKKDVDYDPSAVAKRLADPRAFILLRRVAGSLDRIDRFDDPARVEAVVREAGGEIEMTGGNLIHPLRVALTGRAAGPGLFETMSALGRDRCRQRLIDAVVKFDTT